MSALLTGCSENESLAVRKSEKNERHSNISETNYLKLIKPTNVSLSYSLDKEYIDSLLHFAKLDSMSSRLSCLITNNSSDTVFLVGYSCSDLPGKLTIKPADKFLDWQFFNCNASWPTIHKIAPSEHKEFQTNLTSKDQSRIERLELYVKFVDRWVDFDILKMQPDLIQSVIYTPYEKSSYLKGEFVKNIN